MFFLSTYRSVSNFIQWLDFHLRLILRPIHQMTCPFKIDLLVLHYCLEVEFERNRETNIITMNQRSFIKEVLKHFNMENWKPVGIPFEANSKQLKLSNEEFEIVQREVEDVQGHYRISHLCNGGHKGQYMSKAGPPHWVALKHIMNHLKDTFNLQFMPQRQGYCLERILPCGLGGHANNQQSTPRYVFLIGFRVWVDLPLGVQLMPCWNYAGLLITSFVLHTFSSVMIILSCSNHIICPTTTDIPH